MEVGKTNEQLLSTLLLGMGKQRLLDYLTTVTMSYFVENDDLTREHRLDIHACYLELSYFLKEAELAPAGKKAAEHSVEE